MKTLILAVLILNFAVPTHAAARGKPTRTPPLGISIKESDRNELRAGADALASTIADLRSSLVGKPASIELLPDVEVFHKAVDWALRFDEFYRSNEVALARALLKQGAERARQLRDGKPSWLTATGLVVRAYISKIDGSIQPYGLVVPSSFGTDRTKPRRLDVWLHGRDNNLTELKFISDRQRSYGEFTPVDSFVLHPYGRYCNAFKFAGEVDVFEALEHVKKSYPIDERRIALRGFSMGGAGVWHLAAHHPDVWAVAAPGAGFAESAEYLKLGANRAKVPEWEQKLWQLYDATDYAANFIQLPVIAYNGTDDPQRQAADVMERAIAAEGMKLTRVWGTNVGHKYTPEGKREVSRFVDDTTSQAKEVYPAWTHLTTRTLSYNRAPGIEIDALEQHWRRADVIVREAGAHLELATTNVAGLSVTRARDSKTLKNLIIDGQRVENARSLMSGAELRITLAKDARGNWHDAAALRQPQELLTKKHGLQGPIDDAFLNSFLVVRPTGKPQNAALGDWFSTRLAKATNDWRAHFRGDARVMDDSQVTDANIAENNLVLFGDPQSNRILARIADKLPVKWSAKAIQSGNKTVSAAAHALVLIFPNPLNQERYVVLNSGFTFADGTASNAQQTPKLPDYAVINTADDSIALADFFDEHWQVKRN